MTSKSILYNWGFVASILHDGVAFIVSLTVFRVGVSAHWLTIRRTPFADPIQHLLYLFFETIKKHVVGPHFFDNDYWKLAPTR